MNFEDFMNKVRHWDNLTAKWMMRHFYFMFFQIVLVVIFLFWFTNTLSVIDVNLQPVSSTNLERLLKIQTVNTSIIVIILLLNSFWVLYMFNGLQRLHGLLRDISYHISKLRLVKEKSPP